MSVFIGFVFGMIVTLMMKHFRYLSQSAIGESSLMICFGLLSYFLSEIYEFSGIVSLLTTAVVMGHYSWFNLSPQGKHVTSITFQTLGYFAEAIVFAIIGLTSSFYYMNYQTSW